MITISELLQKHGLNYNQVKYQVDKLRKISKDIQKINSRFGVNSSPSTTIKTILLSLDKNNMDFSQFKDYVSKQSEFIKQGKTEETNEAFIEDLKEVNRVTGRNYMIEDIENLSVDDYNRISDLLNNIATASESKKNQYRQGVYNEISAWVDEIENIFSKNSGLFEINEDSPFD